VSLRFTIETVTASSNTIIVTIGTITFVLKLM